MDQKQNSLNIIYWNARNINQRKTELADIIKDVDIFVCVESWLQAGEEFEVSGFNAVRKDRTHARDGGILYFLRKNLTFTVLNISNCNQDLEIYGVRIENIDPTLDIIACYRTPGNVLSQSVWNSIFDHADNNSHSLFVGDFNAHNKSWNCKDTNKNGIRLEHSYKMENLFLHNTDSFTRVDVRNESKSNIDLVFSTMNVANSVDIEVFDETFGSDHCPISLTVDVNKHEYHKKSFKIRSIKTDWIKFQKYLDEKYNHFLSLEYDQLSASEK